MNLGKWIDSDLLISQRPERQHEGVKQINGGKLKKINKWSMIPRQCQVWALSVLSALSTSINAPHPPPTPPFSPSFHLIVQSLWD